MGSIIPVKKEFLKNPLLVNIPLLYLWLDNTHVPVDFLIEEFSWSAYI